MISLMTLLFMLAATPSQAEPILQPIYSELSAFEAEWCAPTDNVGVERLCYGSVRFPDVGTFRALAFGTAEGHELLYVEQNLSGVEILNPNFAILGPIGREKGSETGTVAVLFDSNGRVASVRVTTPRLGAVRAIRP